MYAVRNMFHIHTPSPLRSAIRVPRADMLGSPSHLRSACIVHSRHLHTMYYLITIEYYFKKQQWPVDLYDLVF